MKLTQNQFYGLKYQMPREFTPGAQYITLDSKEIYIYDESGLPILVGGTEQTVIINNDPDAVLELGDIIKSGANITIPGGIKWRISGIIYNVYTDTVFTINLSNIGFIRKDIIVADNYGVIYLIEGVEDTELAVRPNIPSATVLVTEINVTNTDLDYNNTIIGEDYVKKSFSQPVYYNYGGSNVVLPLPSLGNDKLVLNSDATISISGFNLDSITGNSDAEQIYNGKEYTLINSSETYKTLINQASVEIQMLLKDNANLILPSKESVRFYYENGFFKFLSKSWDTGGGGGGVASVSGSMVNNTDPLNPVINSDTTKEPGFSKNTAFNKDFGTAANTVTEGNDNRLSDARTPLTHTHPQNEVVGLVTDLGNKLDKDISTLTAVSLPLLGTDKLIVNRSGADYSVEKNELNDILSTNTNVSGSYAIDWSKETHRLTLTAASTFTESNLPSASKTKVLSLYVDGNFTLTFPTAWSTNIKGSYDGTKLNLIVIEYISSGVYWVRISN